MLSKNEYGWIKFIEQKVCNQTWEIENFYRRMGVLLAVSDSLNYTDGHYENLIADGEFPILIDGETFFQNYEGPVLKHKSILSTLLIQKINFEEENRLLNSALQAPSGIKLEYLHTHAIYDHTDEIEIRYATIKPSENKHCPILIDVPCNAYDYVEFIKEGYRKAYHQISSKVTEILNNENWWGRVAKVQARTVLRETISYLYLLRKVQAEGVISKSQAEQILFEKLGQTAYTGYEISDLLKQNIPYFYHYPGQKHLYDGNGVKYPHSFTKTAVERLKHQFLNRSKEKMNFDCKILERHLVPAFIEKEESVIIQL